jgi:hypothetical protein
MSLGMSDPPAEGMNGTIRVAEALQRVKGVFLELPGTALSVDQTCHLSGLEQDMCESILLALADAHFVKRARDGRYSRRTTESTLT